MFYGIIRPHTSLYAETSNIELWDLVKFGAFKYLEQSEHMEGIQSPYTYFGQKNTFFAFHREDMNWWALSHHLWGCGKVWYCILPKDYDRLMRIVKKLYKKQLKFEKGCNTPLQHKNYWFDPNILLQNGLKVYCIIQQPGDIVVNPPQGVHGGINMGPNIAVALNFMTESIESFVASWKAQKLLLQSKCEICCDFPKLDIYQLYERHLHATVVNCQKK